MAESFRLEFIPYFRLILVSIFLFSSQFVECTSNSFQNRYTLNNEVYVPKSGISLPSVWDILAPFPIGTREKGVDVVEAFGGIRRVHDAYLSIPSDIVNGGSVSWTRVLPDVKTNSVNVLFNSSVVNWNLIEGWAGLAGAYLAGWAVGDFNVSDSGRYLARCSGVSYFSIDNETYNGDPYNSQLMSVVVELAAGPHTFYVPLNGAETVKFACFLDIMNSSYVSVEDNILPDIVEGDLASPYFSLSMLNTMSNPIEVVVQFAPNQGIQVISQERPTIYPGQTAPINFQAQLMNGTLACRNPTINFTLLVQIRLSPFQRVLSLNCKNFGETFTFTFPDSDLSIQFAAATPPAHPCPNNNHGCPVLLTLHGAGVVANSVFWTQAYRRQNGTWILFPTNRRNFGWDWQGPGLVNAFESLHYLAENLPGVPISLRSQYGADPFRVIYAGHSMGGHGCWTVGTHFPDRALAVVPAAGWISMEMYIPYVLRIGNSFISPFLKYILEASIAEYDVDYYAGHLVGLPLLVRMGGADDNVPPYHLRRMARIVDQLSANTKAVEISEIPGEGHWFDGVVDDDIMQNFFNAHLSDTLPALPEQFVVVTLNPATSEGKGGLRILQLRTPYHEAKISVRRLNVTEKWSLRTQNVLRFGFYHFPTLPFPKDGIIVDGDSVPYGLLPEMHYCRTSIVSSWQLCVDNGTWEYNQRGPRSYGPIPQVLNGPLVIVYGTKGTEAESKILLQQSIILANDLYYQARYSVRMVADTDADDNLATDYNVLFAGGPSTNLFASRFANEFPVKFRERTFLIGSHLFDSEATGIVFLSKLGQSRLAVVMEGTDDRGFIKARQLFPNKSALMLPDYYVAGPEWGWAGDGGLLAAGFWNNNWEFDESIGFISS